MTSVRSGLPASEWARRASLIAESTASDPELVRKTRGDSIGDNAPTRSATRSAGSFVNGSKQWYTAIWRICSVTASVISSRP